MQIHSHSFPCAPVSGFPSLGTVKWDYKLFTSTMPCGGNKKVIEVLSNAHQMQIKSVNMS